MGQWRRHGATVAECSPGTAYSAPVQIPRQPAASTKTPHPTPAKLRSDGGRHIVIRPLAYCREADLVEWARVREFPLDSGCLWGGSLTAVRLEDRRVFQMPCGQIARPTGWQ